MELLFRRLDYTNEICFILEQNNFNNQRKFLLTRIISLKDEIALVINQIKFVKKFKLVNRDIVRSVILFTFFVFIKYKGCKNVIILLNVRVKYNIIYKVLVNELGFQNIIIKIFNINSNRSRKGFFSKICKKVQLFDKGKEIYFFIIK